MKTRLFKSNVLLDLSGTSQQPVCFHRHDAKRGFFFRPLSNDEKEKLKSAENSLLIFFPRLSIHSPDEIARLPPEIAYGESP